ncbi:MAG: YceI family protein [Chitinophagales bacterium]
MKRVSVFTILALVGFAFTSPQAEKQIKVDATKTQINWTGYKVTGQHTGTLQLNSGSFIYDEGVLTGGSFEVDMNSLTVTDLEGDMAGKLKGHLMSADFFGVEKFPTASFNITKVVPQGPNRYKVIGDLTIKETTKEIRFNTTVDQSSGVPVASAKITLDRSDFNIRYGSGSFFDNLGDKTIYDDFDLNLTVVGASK